MTTMWPAFNPFDRSKVPNPRTGRCRSALRELDRRHRPAAVMAPDRDAQAVEFVEIDVLHGSGLAIAQRHRLADQLDLRMFELAQDAKGSRLDGNHENFGI